MTSRARGPAGCLAVVGILIVLAGCRDDLPVTTRDSPPSERDAGAEDAGEDGAYTLDNVCGRVAREVCALRKPCCVGRYDETGCVMNAQTSCLQDVEDARAGRATFHPERIVPCFTKTTALISSCPLSTFDVFYRLVADAVACQTFAGSLATGAACQRDSQCKPSESANGFAVCAGTPRVCTLLQLLSANEVCKFDGSPTLCGKDLFCDADFTLKPPSGTCKTVTPLGAACDKAKAINLQCGAHNFCDKVSGVCTAGKASGACQIDGECASGVCEVTSKTCKAIEPLLKTEDCRGF